MTDVVALDSPRGGRQLEQLGQVLRGQQVLFAGPAGPFQFVVGIALDQLDQVRLLSPLGNSEAHLATAQFREPVLDELLLWQGLLEQQLGGNLDPLHLAVVLFDHRLQDPPHRSPTVC